VDAYRVHDAVDIVANVAVAPYICGKSCYFFAKSIKVFHRKKFA